MKKVKIFESINSNNLIDISTFFVLDFSSYQFDDYSSTTSSSSQDLLASRLKQDR